MTRLLPNDSEAKRDAALKQAIYQREQEGDPVGAIPLFTAVAGWDEENDRNASDAWGHTRIAYTLAADKTSGNERVSFIELAKHAAGKAVKTAHDDGQRAIAQTHLASTLLREGATEQAIEILREAMTNLPGSQAHRAWPGAILVRALIKTGRIAEAERELTDLYAFLNQGWEKELQSTDGEMKLAIWKAGLGICEALLQIALGEKEKAIAALNGILNEEDPEKYLTARKEEAEGILETLT